MQQRISNLLQASLNDMETMQQISLINSAQLKNLKLGKGLAIFFGNKHGNSINFYNELLVSVKISHGCFFGEASCGSVFKM